MKYRIHISEIKKTFFEDLFKGLEWDTSDTLLIVNKMKKVESDIITLDEKKYAIVPCKLLHKSILRLFLYYGNSYDSDYENIIYNRIPDVTKDINKILEWKEDIVNNNCYFYNLSLLEQNGLLKSDEIKFYMSTTDSVLRKMFLEIIINKLNNLNNGNN